MSVLTETIVLADNGGFFNVRIVPDRREASDLSAGIDTRTGLSIEVGMAHRTNVFRSKQI
jgi:hypothetical protein